MSWHISQGQGPVQRIPERQDTHIEPVLIVRDMGKHVEILTARREKDRSFRIAEKIRCLFHGIN